MDDTTGEAPILQSDGFDTPVGALIHNLQLAALGCGMRQKTILSLMELAILLLDESFQRKEPCPNVSLEVKGKGRIVSLVVDTASPWRAVIERAARP